MHNFDIERSPLIITGNQRTGSTFLTTLLSSHPLCSVGSEDGLIRLAIIWFKSFEQKNELLPYARYNEFFNLLKIRTGNKYIELSKSIEIMIREMYANKELDFRLNAWSSEDLIRKICYRYYSCNSKRELAVLGDKYPEYCFILEDIVRVFPLSKFIFLLRHPYSSIEAIHRKLHGLSDRLGKILYDIEDCVLQYKNWNIQWLNFRDNLPSNRKLEIKYEDLIENTEHTLDEISSFLGIDLHLSSNYNSFLNNRNKNKLSDYMQSKIYSDIVELCSKHEIAKLFPTIYPDCY